MERVHFPLNWCRAYCVYRKSAPDSTRIHQIPHGRLTVEIDRQTSQNRRKRPLKQKAEEPSKGTLEGIEGH